MAVSNGQTNRQPAYPERAWSPALRSAAFDYDKPLLASMRQKRRIDMAKQPRQRSGKKFSGNHQRSWLWGFHAVFETLTAARWPVLEILMTQAASERAASLLAENARGIPLSIVTAERIEELSRATDHQGMLLRLGPFPYTSQEQLERTLQASLASPTKGNMPLLVMCDRLQDSFNLGAILRCCDGTNVQAVIVGEKGQAEMTSHVARSSSGAINYLPIVKSPDLVATALRLKSLGLKLLAGDANATQSMWDVDFGHPAVLIIGSEATGVDEQLLAICDQRALIPMHGQVNSLNAAVASGILLYEIRRQQRQQK